MQSMNSSKMEEEIKGGEQKASPSKYWPFGNVIADQVEEKKKQDEQEAKEKKEREKKEEELRKEAERQARLLKHEEPFFECEKAWKDDGRIGRLGLKYEEEPPRFDTGTYRGYLKDGKKLGPGTFKWDSESTYHGEFLNDYPHGKGLIKHKDGSMYKG